MKALTDIRVALIAGVLIMLTLVGCGWWLHSAGYTAGQLGERSAWQKTEQARAAAVRALETQHAADLEAERQKNISVNLKVSQDHETELQTLRAERDADRRRADAVGGLRIPAEVCAGRDRPGPGPEAAGAGGRDEASASTVRLPLPVENDLWAIVNDADEVSAQLRSCQTWIRNNGFYGIKPEDSGQLLDRMIAEPNHPAEDTP